MRFVALLGLIILTAACDPESVFIKTVEPDKVPKGEQKLVIHCYISPQDTVLTAVVNRSRAVFGEPNSFQNGSLSGASVTLSDGNRSIDLQLRYDSSRGVPLHRADARLFPIQVGKTYTLKASLSSGESVTATCTVPGPVPIRNFQIDSLPDPNIQQGLSYYVKFNWQDPANETNYYRVAGDNEYGGIRTDYIQGKFVETPARIVGTLFLGDESPFLTDAGVNGQTMTSPSGRLSFMISNGKLYAGRPVLINVYLLNTDANYYRYHENLDRAIEAQNNPFAEPVLIPSNIQGGLGCFGAYNRSTLSMQLP